MHYYAKQPQNRPQNIVTTDVQKHKTLGFLACAIFHSDMQAAWLGAQQAAQEHHVNLIHFNGGVLRDPRGHQAQANVLYELIHPEVIAGLVVYSSALEWAISPAEMDAFLRRYHPLPVVTIESAFPMIPVMRVDNYQGMRAVMRHLLEVHGYRRIAFIRGPEGHIGAQERYRAYCETAAEYGCLDLNLVGLPGPWEERHGAETVTYLLDERQAAFDAIIGTCDDFTIGALHECHRRGMSVPDMVAIAGFDDYADSQAMTPPITTTRVPFYQLGYQAVEALCAMLAGQTIPQEIPVQPALVVRQSCGCPDPNMIRVTAWPEKTSVAESIPVDLLTTALRSQYAQFEEKMRQAAEMPEQFAEGVQTLVETFLTDIQGVSTGQFLHALDRLLRHVADREGDVIAWQDVISVFRQQLTPFLREVATLSRAEDLWHQARVLIGATAQRSRLYQSLQAEHKARALSDFSQALITTFDTSGLMQVLADGLPPLGIARCLLAVYNDPAHPADGAQLLLAYGETGRKDRDPNQQCFRAGQLAPEGFLSQMQPYSLLLEALYFKDIQLGFVLFDAKPQEGKMYELLRGEISSALQGALLVQHIQERTAEVARQKYILDTFMANVPDAIYFKDRESRFTNVNNALAHLFGASAPIELIGKTDFDFFSESEARPKYQQEQDIIRTGQPLLSIEEPDAGGRWALTTKMPLRDEHGTIIGTFGISRDITALKQTQVELAAAYEEIRVINHQLKDENIRISAEMDLAKRIQTALLPRAFRNLHPDFEIAAVMRPAEEVGGDYYDVALDRAGTLWLGIGDVSGHGVTPGLIMMMTQTIHTTITANYTSSPREMVTQINKVLYKNVQERLLEDQFMTFTTLKYLGTGQFQHAGSHLDLIVYRQSTGRCDLIDTPGTWLNLLPDISDTTENQEFRLEIGDVMVLYTDGITEAWNPHQEIFDTPRLIASVMRHADQDPQTMCDRILHDTLAWSNQVLHDDMSLVVARRVR